MGFFKIFKDIARAYYAGYTLSPRQNYLNGVASSYIGPGPTRFHHREAEIIICGSPEDAGLILGPGNFEKDYSGQNLPSGFYVRPPNPGFGWYPCILNNNVLLVCIPHDEASNRTREATCDW